MTEYIAYLWDSFLKKYVPFRGLYEIPTFSESQQFSFRIDFPNAIFQPCTPDW